MAFKSPHRMIQSRRRTYDDGILGLVGLIFKFDPALVTFTPNMDKRAAPGPFETAPIIQGKWEDDYGDRIRFLRNSAIAGSFYRNIDSYQGSVSFWITPEWDGNDNWSHGIMRWGNDFRIYKSAANELILIGAAAWQIAVDISGWTAGTTYHVICRWDSKNTLDGTNYMSISINNVHSYSGASPSLPDPAYSSSYFGGTAKMLDAIIEGFTIYRRPLFDGTYGVAVNWDDGGPIDEIEEIYAAGAGVDPCLITGSWDVVFCLPTDSTAEALVTGTGEAWSHPHSSGVLEHQYLEDGGYLGGPWGMLFDGGWSDIVTVLDHVSIQDLHDGAMTVEAWIRMDGDGSGGWTTFARKGTSWTFRTNDFGQLQSYIWCAVNDAFSVGTTDIRDGKLHHIAMTWDDAVDNFAHLWLDGVEETYSNSGNRAGAVVTDVGQNLYLYSRLGLGTTLNGVFGWTRISDNIRYSAVFVPIRTAPASDGNTVILYHVDEGTGVTLDNETGTAATDGTITGGTWEEQWDIETTPIVPYSIELSGVASWINCGTAADIDDVPSGGVITAEVWISAFGITGYDTLMSKSTDWNASGWYLNIDTNGHIAIRVNLATTDATVGSLLNTADNKHHHIAITYNDATKTVALYIDGIRQWDNLIVGAGAYQTDAAGYLLLGSLAFGDSFDGYITWARYSDIIRYTDEFTPPSRLNPPGVDGNTLRQFNFRDGAGAILTDATGTANAAITNGVWHITPDMEIDSPGERIFNWGYVIGNDAVDEGIKETLSGLSAGQNYVVRAVAHVESASRGRPKVIIYDETNGAQITALEGPSFTGNHDGGPNSPTLTDTTARFPQMLVGWTLYNITDGSSTTITAISGDFQTITGVLAGGTDNDWDIGDEYRIVPPGGPSEYDDYPWIETFTFELPTIARNGVAADCTSISFKLVNGVNEGVIKWHQVELLGNLIDNPSLETGVGNPWIPDGWINSGLDPGDTVQELVTVHSGLGAIEWDVNAVANEGIYYQDATISGYVMQGGWIYGDGIRGLSIGTTATTRGVLQYDPALAGINTSIDAHWEHAVGVWRKTTDNWRSYLSARNGNVGDRWLDDIYAFELDDVILTITPASLVNSTEDGGLRVDGRDACTQPILVGYLGATSGHIKFNYTPRHDSADTLNFNAQPEICRLHLDGTRWIYVRYTLASVITLAFNDGGGQHVGTWNPATLVADTEYMLEIKYNSSQMEFKVDGITQTTIVTPINFTGIPTTAYWGHSTVSAEQGDGVFAAP